MSQMSHASHQTIVNVIRSVARIQQTNKAISKLKALSFFLAVFFIYKHFFIKINQSYGFCASQSLKLSRRTCFCVFKYVFVEGEFPSDTTWKTVFVENVDFNILSFKSGPYNNFWPTTLGDLNVILAVQNGFPANWIKSSDTLFFTN